jgi:hypothetical protein
MTAGSATGVADELGDVAGALETGGAASLVEAAGEPGSAAPEVQAEANRASPAMGRPARMSAERARPGRDANCRDNCYRQSSLSAGLGFPADRRAHSPSPTGDDREGACHETLTTD